MKGLCGNNIVEIKPPTEDEAICILVAAAGLSKTDAAPQHAGEIVALCNRLPLSLAIAGKLISDLQLGADWEGVTDILGDELRENSAASSEQRVINASLAALGESKESDNIRALFKLMALIPEDSVAPLDVLAMMFDAVYNPELANEDQGRGGVRTGRHSRKLAKTSITMRKIPVLLIRKWLTVLQSRSLVLGTVDRAQLHDLVLDYAIAQHTNAELRLAHEHVVNYFRSHRTVSPANLVGWSTSNRGDATTAYVMNEVEHHISAAWNDEESETATSTLLSWVTDNVFDCITYATARVLGQERLLKSAESAERASDWFRAACMWDKIAYLRFIEGSQDETLIQFRINAMRAIQNLEIDPITGKDASGVCLSV